MTRKSKLESYVIEVGSGSLKSNYAWSAPKNLYSGIATQLGVKKLTGSAAKGATFGRAGSELPRLRISFEGGGGALVFCDPGKLEAALSGLVGKKANGKKIQRVKIPKRRIFV